MKGLRAFEQIDGHWTEIDQLVFSVVVGEEPSTRFLRFSPYEGVVHNLQARIEGGEDLKFVEGLSGRWEDMNPKSVRTDQFSDPIKIAVAAEHGSYRTSSFCVVVQYLQGPVVLAL